ncbi:kinetochore-associated protein DSN1 homolog isoform X2 [Gambusia affinis]|uniref:kinetochore-associated protein DSN1 homolog isoform X2 n=1 Tax=Gambusia affinis TaxID=33528 RepID=UPI000F304139|nr:kinetochore-associated protein DSN1 homolog isoform X2 [Gambusia affinis]
MAEKKAEVEHGSGRIEADETSVEVSSTVQTSKRCSSLIPESEPPFKCPRSDSTSFTTQMPDPGDEQSEVMKQEMETLTERPVNPREQNKSWRRNTITRRSLPALPNPYETLCRNISPSLSQQERLEKLLEASMEMALERTQNSLESFPKASLDSFKKQVENIKMEWSCLTKNTSNEPHKLSSSQPNCSQPAVQRAMENVQKAIIRLKAESESWEALMNKHKKSAEELEKKVKMGQETGIPLNSTLIVQSSQNSVIQSKPNYHNVLCRQQPMMHTMAMIMDTQCKMIQQLLTIKEQSQLLVKKTSVQLAEEAGFQELSSNLLKNLMSAPLQKATT